MKPCAHKNTQDKIEENMETGNQKSNLKSQNQNKHNKEPVTVSAVFEFKQWI